MTALISWVGYDNRTASSLNLASDSRITFGSRKWDFGRKIFALQHRPEVFGYCGDVLFPSQVLGQLSSMIERGLLVSDSATNTERTGGIREFLQLSAERYPKTAARPFSILYAIRSGLGTTATFSLYQFDCDARGSVTVGEVPLPARGKLYAIGFGAPTVETWFKLWGASDVQQTSRTSFCSLADAIRSNKDPSTGGAPQLASIYNGIPQPQETGVIWRGSRFLNGAPIPVGDALGGVRWRNELFEVCDGETGLRQHNAQRQPRPAQVPNPD
jgi:hypothetical protein